MYCFHEDRIELRQRAAGFRVDHKTSFGGISADARRRVCSWLRAATASDLDLALSATSEGSGKLAALSGVSTGHRADSIPFRHLLPPPNNSSQKVAIGTTAALVGSLC